jgi:hypothetical protein
MVIKTVSKDAFCNTLTGVERENCKKLANAPAKEIALPGAKIETYKQVTYSAPTGKNLKK